MLIITIILPMWIGELAVKKTWVACTFLAFVIVECFKHNNINVIEVYQIQSSGYCLGL
jgi:hypothetical protein